MFIYTYTLVWNREFNELKCMLCMQGKFFEFVMKKYDSIILRTILNYLCPYEQVKYSQGIFFININQNDVFSKPNVRIVMY